MKDNKGFSLLELIVVISIMAILVGFIVPQYIKHVRRSKEVNDEQLVTAIHNAIGAAILDENIDDRPLTGFGATIRFEDLEKEPLYSAHYSFVNEVKEFLAVNSLEEIKNNLKSNAFKGQDILIYIDDSTQKVKVSVSSNEIGVDDLIVE